MTHSEAPPPTKQGPRIGFAAAFGLGVVPVALLLVVHGRSDVPRPAVLAQDRVADGSADSSAPVEGGGSKATVAPAAPKTAAPALERPASEEEYFQRLDALRSSAPADALAWVERGQEWYGSEGKYAEARTAMQVTLLVDLSRMPEARAITRKFILEHPDSPYRPLMQGVTGIHPRPGPPASVAARHQ